MCSTVCCAAEPLLKTVRYPSVNPSSAATFCATRNRCPTSASSSSVRSSSVGIGLAWHDQDVRGCLGVDVAQSHALVVFIKDVPRLLPVHNLLEQRVLGHKEQLSGQERASQQVLGDLIWLNTF
jgi:hypothetical protein